MSWRRPEYEEDMHRQEERNKLEGHRPGFPATVDTLTGALKANYATLALQDVPQQQFESEELSKASQVHAQSHRATSGGKNCPSKNLQNDTLAPDARSVYLSIPFSESAMAKAAELKAKLLKEREDKRNRAETDKVDKIVDDENSQSGSAPADNKAKKALVTQLVEHAEDLKDFLAFTHWDDLEQRSSILKKGRRQRTLAAIEIQRAALLAEEEQENSTTATTLAQPQKSPVTVLSTTLIAKAQEPAKPCNDVATTGRKRRLSADDSVDMRKDVKRNHRGRARHELRAQQGHDRQDHGQTGEEHRQFFGDRYGVEKRDDHARTGNYEPQFHPPEKWQGELRRGSGTYSKPYRGRDGRKGARK